MVLNLWVASPLGLNDPLHRGHLRSLEKTGIYIMVPNSHKLAVKITMVGDHNDMRNCTKGSRQKES